MAAAITQKTDVNALIEGMSIEELEQVNEVMGKYRGMPDYVLKKFIECDSTIQEAEL